MNFSFSVIATRKFIRHSTKIRDCAKQNAFQFGRKKYQMVHGAWRDSMTVLFKILWRMKHTVRSPIEQPWSGLINDFADVRSRRQSPSRESILLWELRLSRKKL